MGSLSFERVSKQYGQGARAVPVIAGLDAQIADGEFVVIVGPSGCGKSTLLRMVAGLEDITGGEIRIDGRVINGLEPAERDIAMVFQNYALYPHMTVFQNMSYGLRIAGLASDEIERRVGHAAQILEISELLARKPRELSGGQRQRVAMGRAIVRQPKVFLFDEPLSNLDARLRAQTRLEIRRLHAELRTTTLFVTHDQVEAMTLAERMIVMNAGAIEQIGTPESVYERPASLFVASFIGSPPMNLLRDWAALGTRFQEGVVQNVGQNVILGVRPEDAVIVDAPSSGALWPFAVEVIEMLGAERLIHGRVGTESVIVRQEASRPAPCAGQQVSLQISPSKLHSFDARTGRRTDHAAP
ncbi:MAG: sn-glycerol-3-phosphate ABC transporter ATP-binding protein UgpC [Betaproteobacteria bacterium]|jgi:sn-glycerol 3-phosphate transport system ATP-binding protein|nr:sn-glycerol-3-phosphate ABC transporter ATP-binding protein UgpC [Betaproteobacteria bacterium]